MSATPQITDVTVFGGTGFLGREIVAALAAAGLRVRVACRHPDTDDQGIETVYADVRDETSVALALAGSDAAVNTVGLYLDHGAETFAAVHENGARNLARQCAEAGLARLIQVSGIGADTGSESSYVRARAKGELLAAETFPDTTILRPSALFGPRDQFINGLAAIIRTAPIIPLFGNGATLLQPVYVGDVAAAVAACLRHAEAPGRIYELGGPEAIRYRDLLRRIMRATGRQRPILPVPFVLWSWLAALCALLPRPPLTRAQVALMRRDNVVADDMPSLADLGIEPTSLETVLPDYPF